MDPPCGIATPFVCTNFTFTLFLKPHFGSPIVASNIVAVVSPRMAMAPLAIGAFLVAKSIRVSVDVHDMDLLPDNLCASVFAAPVFFEEL